MAHSQNTSERSGRNGQNSGQATNGQRERSPPLLRRLVDARSAGDVMHPDTEENVGAQTEDIFLNYVYQSYRNDTMRGQEEETPTAPELMNFTAAPITPAAEIGRQLARLGDSLNEKYADVFQGMVTQLNIGCSGVDAYEDFASIGRRVFTSGITWNRILMLLGFGYRMAIQVLRTQASNFTSFLSRIVSFICRFIMTERIASWIAAQGGWRAALNYIPDSLSSLVYLVPGLAALSVLAVYAFHRFLR